MKVKLVKTKFESKHIKTFYFSSEKPVRYIAGQFIELYLPHEQPDDRGQKRWFTLSSSPTENLLSITTRYAGVASSTYKQTLFSLNIGTELEMASPMGDFILPKLPEIPLIFVAGGLGITPYRSIIKYVQDSSNEKRDITLIHSVKDSSDLIFNTIFSKLGARYIQLIGTRLTDQEILRLSKPTNQHYIYLSGPEPMVESLNNKLKKGLGKYSNIYTDFFPGYTY